jgi:hypothetical protein
MAALEQKIAEGIVAYVRAAASATWAALVGGTGSDMKIGYATEKPFANVNNAIQVRPLDVTPETDDFGDSATSIYAYEIVIRFGDHVGLADTLATLRQNLIDLFRPDVWGSGSLREFIQTADTESNIRGEAIDITASVPIATYEEEEGDPAMADIRMEVAITVDHVVPRVYA